MVYQSGQEKENFLLFLVSLVKHISGNLINVFSEFSKFILQDKTNSLTRSIKLNIMVKQTSKYSRENITFLCSIFFGIKFIRNIFYIYTKKIYNSFVIS